MLEKESNLTKFMEDFPIAFPTRSDAKGVYAFVYNLHEPVPAEELPEDTSLRRAIKKHLTEGGYIYEKGGLRLF